MFSLKETLTGQAVNNGTNNAEIMVPLQYLSNFWRPFEMPLINCGITLDLDWSGNCVIVATNEAAQATAFSITDTKLYVTVETLSTQDNGKLLEQFKSGFKRTINWNNKSNKKSTKRVTLYLHFLIDPSFQAVNRFVVLPLENEAHRTSYKRYYPPTREIENYNAVIDEQHFFD